MDAIQRQVLTSERLFLDDNLQVNQTFMSALVSRGTISLDDMERLEKRNVTRLDRVSDFIFSIQTKGPYAFEDFLFALQRSGQAFIADQLQKALAKVKETMPGGSKSQSHVSQKTSMYRAILRNNLPYFVKNLKADADLIAQLLSTDTLHDEEWEKIKAEKDMNERVIKLCQILQEKHAVGYGGLMTAVKATGKLDVLKKLQEFETESWSKQVTDVQCKRVLLHEEGFLMEDLVMTLVFLDYLVMNSVISPQETDRLMESQFPGKQKVMMLCGMVADKGRAAFGGFMAALSASGQEDVKSRMVRALAECKSSPDSQKAAGATAAMGEAAGGEVSGLVEGATDELAVELARLCVDGSNVNSAGETGWTGLHLAAEDGWTDDASTLIRAGANLTARNVLGHTPLHFACLYGHTSTVCALLAAGADTQSRDIWGYTPRDWARVRGHAAILELLPP